VLTDQDSRVQFALATTAVMEDQYYQALKALRSLLPREERLLAARPG
jgi:flagellar protein FlbT